MSVCLDANIVVALLTEDSLTSRARELLRANLDLMVISDYTAAEFASVVARQVRVGGISAEMARIAFGNFDLWVARHSKLAETKTSDVWVATSYMRRLDLNLRTPDAIHLAICSRIGATLATFDDKLAAAAKVLGTPVAVA